MAAKTPDPPRPAAGKRNGAEMNRIVTEARKAREERLKGYRERSLKIHPWVCARCGREFSAKNLRLLTVHHRDHNHDYNPPDGSNWENLCLYCHDNEHRRYLDHVEAEGYEVDDPQPTAGTHRPFAGLADLLKDRNKTE